MNFNKKGKEELVDYIAYLEQKLDNQAYYYENILSLLPGHIYWLDKNNVYLGCNDQQAIDGNLSSRKAIRGKTNAELPWSEQAEQLDLANKQVFETGNRLKIIEFARLGDDVRTYLSEKIPLFDKNNKIEGLLGVSIDITELEKTKKSLEIAKQKAEAANKAKAEFIANMSHDIRTPLSGMIGISNILEDEAPDETIKEYAHMLNISGEQLLSLLNSVLELVSTGALGREKLNVKPFRIKELLNNIFELELPSLKLKDIDFKLAMEENVPETVLSDKEKIYRILLNILSNAIKFTHSGSITIQVNLVEAKDDDITLCFKVIDTGVGIAKDDVHKVFDQFYRSTSSYEGNFEGYGVGLHIVREYLDRLNGKVAIESEIGIGTSFSLTIPMKKAKTVQKWDSELKTALPQKDANIKIKTHQKNEDAFVLLVEDNFIARKMAVTLLTKSGCRVMQADTAAKAFDLCRQQRFDFILSDIGLPDYSGLRLTQKIHQYEEENGLPLTPVIGLSAHAHGDAIADANASGMIDLAEKPLKTGLVEKLIYKFGYGNSKKANTPVQKTQKPLAKEAKPSDAPLLDVALALSQLGDKGVLKALLVNMLEESMVDDTDAIAAYFQSKDWDGFKKQVHKFKSSCLYCATTRLLKLTQALEKVADTQDIKQIKPVYRQFNDCVVATREHIESWLSKHPE